MPRFLPRTLKLPFGAVSTPHGLPRHVAATLRPPASDLARAVHAYAFKCDERAFAAALLGRRTQLWLFRTHQAAACGDFVAVDLSSPDPARRPVFVLELKAHARLREGGGPSAWQVRHAALAVAELAAGGVVAPGAGYTVLAGDAPGILTRLGA